METAEQHYGLAAILPALPRHDTELKEKHELWATILSDWIQDGSVVATVVEKDNPTLRMDLALLGLTLLRWFDEGSEEESASVNELGIGHDKSYCNLVEFFTILGESVQVREAMMALLASASDPSQKEVQDKILKACCTTIDFLYNCVAVGYSRQNQQNRTRHDSLVASNLLPVLVRAMEPYITGAIPADLETLLQLRMALCWCCSIDSPDHPHLVQTLFIMRVLQDLGTRSGAQWNMRVILQTQPYIDALVAGITTLTHLVQLQTLDLQDSTMSLWAQGLLDSRNTHTHTHTHTQTGLHSRSR